MCSTTEVKRKNSWFLCSAQKNQFFGGQRGPVKGKKRRLVTRLKSKVGLVLAKAAVLRIVINLDGVPIASKSHTHPSHSQYYARNGQGTGWCGNTHNISTSPRSLPDAGVILCTVLMGTTGRSFALCVSDPARRYPDSPGHPGGDCPLLFWHLFSFFKKNSCGLGKGVSR